MPSEEDVPDSSANAPASASAGATVELLLDIFAIPVAGLFIIGRCLYGPGAGFDLWFLAAASIYAIMLLLGSPPAGRRNWMDWSLLVVVLVETACYVNSTYRANSLPDYYQILFLFLFYCFVKLHLKQRYQQVGVFSLLTLFGLYLSVPAIYSFYRQYTNLTSLGFADVTGFKQYFDFLQTGGAPLGEWVTLYLILLPFPILLFARFVETAPASSWLLLCPVVTILVIITATFSRGAYVATAAFFVSAGLLFRLYRLAPPKRLISFGVCALLLLATVVCVSPLKWPVLTTASMFKTTSQVRSFGGRTSLWKESWQIAKERPWFGVGASNFAAQYAARKEDESVFVGRTFNIFLQLLVEKGVAGLLAYCLLFFSFFKVSHEKIKLLRGDTFRTTVAVLFMAACVALLVRDLSYSSVLTNEGVGAVLWFMFASNARPEPALDDAGEAGRIPA